MAVEEGLIVREDLEGVLYQKQSFRLLLYFNAHGLIPYLVHVGAV
jgi:hypothetical protein